MVNLGLLPLGYLTFSQMALVVPQLWSPAKESSTHPSKVLSWGVSELTASRVPPS